ncbi:MAG TPA: TatD family hydrolase [Methylomirabilota bacterium]|nr:TatD family hydrolase [Methylomirabilota bacterium]
MAVFYDTHGHLDYPDFQPEFADVLARARHAGIAKTICIGTNFESSRRAMALAEAHEEISAVVGWHPSDALDAPDDVRPMLREMGKHPKVVAIGETGLDYYRMPSAKGGSAADDDHYKRKQAQLFQHQLEVAAELRLNCVIHQRGETLEDTLSIMQPFVGNVRGVFHCFSSGLDVLERIRALGSIVSFTGIVTFKNGQNVRDAVAATPLGEFMLETDCPFLAPIPYRGKRCEPAYVKEIADTVAQVKGCSLDELSGATCATARAFFPKLQS